MSFTPLDYLTWTWKEGENIFFTSKCLGSLIHDLYAKGFNHHGFLSTIDIVVVTHYKYGIKSIVEIVGFDPEKGEILTNEVFTYVPELETLEFNGKSYFLELMMGKYNLKKEDILKEVHGQFNTVFRKYIEVK